MRKKMNMNRLASVNKLFADRINLKLPLAKNNYTGNRRNDWNIDAFNGDNDNDEDEIKLSNTASTITSD